MHLLYLDESGNPDDAADGHFVLAGVSVFERAVHALSISVEAIQAKHFPGLPPVEFHASQIRNGRDFWRQVDKAKRNEILIDLADTLVDSGNGVVLFATAVQKSDECYGEEAVRRATEDICKRFDMFVGRKESQFEDQRGLLVFAESHYEQRAKTWVRDFKRLGTQWGGLHKICDIPYFANTRESRLLQMADLVAHAVFLAYERGSVDLLERMAGKFDRQGARLHGLTHLKRDKSQSCECMACAGRRGQLALPDLSS